MEPSGCQTQPGHVEGRQTPCLLQAGEICSGRSLSRCSRGGGARVWSSPWTPLGVEGRRGRGEGPSPHGGPASAALHGTAQPSRPHRDIPPPPPLPASVTARAPPVGPNRPSPPPPPSPGTGAHPPTPSPGTGAHPLTPLPPLLLRCRRRPTGDLNVERSEGGEVGSGQPGQEQRPRPPRRFPHGGPLSDLSAHAYVSTHRRQLATAPRASRRAGNTKWRRGGGSLPLPAGSGEGRDLGSVLPGLCTRPGSPRLQAASAWSGRVWCWCFVSEWLGCPGGFCVRLDLRLLW